MNEGIPQPSCIASDSEPLPFSKNEITDSEEMRRHRAGACGLSENATLEEIDNAEEKILTKKAATWLWISP